MTVLEERRGELPAQNYEERFRLLAEFMAEGIYSIDLNGDCTFCNPACVRLLGYTAPEDLLGKDMHALMHHTRPDGTAYPVEECRIYQAFREEKGSHVNDEVMWRADGTSFHAEYWSAPVRCGDRICGAIVAFLDTSERKRTEDALRAAEERYRSLLANIPDVTWTTNARAETTFISPNVERVIGFTPEEEYAGGADVWFGRIHPEDRGTVIQAFENLFRKDETFDVEYRFQRKDGHWIWLNDRAICTYEKEGIRYADGIFSDITERKSAEQEKLLLATAVEQASEGVMITDASGSIEYVNPAFTRNTQYTREEAIGRNPRFLKSGRHDRCFYESLWETILSGKTWKGEVVNRRKDGRLITEQMSVTPVRDSSGKIHHFIAIKSDITSRKSLEAQLLQAQKMEAVGRLAGGVAHDFNNMLSIILGYSELALGHLEPGNPLQKSIGKIKDAATRAASLTQQLLAFSRKQLLEPRTLDLSAAVSEMAKMLHRLIGEDIELVLSLRPALGMVKADPAQLDQVLLNLAVNARDAMPQGGRLTIETADVELDEAYSRQHPLVPPGSYVTLSVTDTGVGMSKETQEHIFEPFFTTKETGKGTGLGLATVYGVVKQSGGFIWVYSEPGHGTTFKIYLPRVEAPAPVASASQPRLQPKGSETVLLVEDEAMLRELGRSLLEDLGYQVVEASHGAEAVELARRYPRPIHLLMTDLVMPGMNGRELAERLRDLRPGLEVLFVSGYTDDVVFREGLLNPGTAFLQKPFTKDALARKLREVLAEGGPKETFGEPPAPQEMAGIGRSRTS